MDNRIDIRTEVESILAAELPHALTVLPSFAGELLAAENEEDIHELKDALGLYVIRQGPNVDVAEAVLAMVRTYSIRMRAHYSR